MPSKLIQCTQCKEVKWMNQPDFRTYKKRFGIKTSLELSKIYVCRKCRGDQSRTIQNIKQTERNAIDPIKNIQRDVQAEVDTLIKRGVNDFTARQNFMSNISSLMKSKHLEHYEFDIQNNILVGLKLNKIPLLGDIYIKIKGLGSI